MSSINVDIVAAHFGGRKASGSEISLEYLMPRFERMLSRLRILITRKPEKPMSSVIPIPGTTFLPHQALILGNIVVDEWLARNLQRIWRKDKPDVIHVWDNYVLPPSLKLSKKLKIPIVANMLNELVTPTIGISPLIRPLASFLLHRRDKLFLRSFSEVDHIITVSNFIKRQFINLGIDGGKITAAHFAVAPEVESPASAPKKRKERLVLAGGRISEQKGFHVLAEAITMIPSLAPDIQARFEITGEGPYRGKFEETINVSPAKGLVRVHGRVSRSMLYQFFREADIIVQPTVTQEPFSRVLMEAMAYGKPLVATNVGGTPEAVEDGVNGLLVPPNDPKSLAIAIVRLLQDDDLRAEMGSRSREILRERFDPELIAKKIVGVYEHVARAKATHPNPP